MHKAFLPIFLVTLWLAIFAAAELIRRGW